MKTPKITAVLFCLTIVVACSDTDHAAKRLDVVNPQTIVLNDRNATERTGASGSATVGNYGDPASGIIANKGQVYNLLPNHDYFVTETIQPSGAFEPSLGGQLPNVFWSTLTTNAEGTLTFDGTFPGPAAALVPGSYRIDIFITHTHATVAPSTEEGETVMQAIGSFTDATDPLLFSEPFSTGTVVRIEEANSIQDV